MSSFSISNGNRMRLVRRFALVLLVCIALVAAACGSDDDDETSDTTATTSAPTTTSTAPPDTTPQTTQTTVEVDVVEANCPVYEDPRGGVFQEYQNEFDRCHPFQPLDTFCVEHDVPDVAREATDPGITEDTITLVHLRSRLEELAAFGFATDVGDPARMFDTYAWYVNNMCGGINGRMIDLKLVEVAATADNIDELRNAACIEATEDNDAVVVINSSGFQGSASLCLVEEHETAFVSTQGQSGEFMDRGEGRLIAFSPTLEESLSFLVEALVDSGELEGKTIGVVAPDTPGQREAVERGLVTPLRDAGFDVPVFDTIGCSAGGCTEGNTDSVSRMLDEGVDVIFPTLNVLSLPQYLGEMVNQGFEPGDVMFYNSDFNSQASNIVVSKIVQFAGAGAGELYNGAIIIDDADPAAFHEPDWEPRPFNQMCADIYDTYHQEVEGNENLTQPPHDPSDPASNTPHGMVASVCAQFRAVMRAIYDAGANPTRQDIYEALTNLGAIDFNNMIPNSIRPGKPQTPDVIHALQFSYPCASGEEFGTDQGTCIVNAEGSEWRKVSR